MSENAELDEAATRVQALSRLAHDLRGATGIVLGALYELEASLGADAPQYAKLLGMARRGADRSVKVAEQLAGVVATARAALEAAPAAPTPAPSSAVARSVLLVDDDEDSTMLLTTLLERDGWTVQTAATLAAARELIADKKPAALVCDLHLPDGEGPALLSPSRPASLRAAVLLTGDRDPAAQATLRAQGFDGVLCKPTEPQALLALLRKLVDAPAPSA